MPNTPPLNPTLVSVVIPCFNQARYLPDAIDSALSQSHAPVEIIVVNDGSTDETATVMRRYAEIKRLEQSNSGLSAARNAGLHEASGAFILFLDADDVLRPRAIEHGLDCFAEHPKSAFVFGAHIRVDAERRPVGPPQSASIGTDPFGSLLKGNLVGMHAAALYRRDVLTEAGGFDSSLRACEDYDIYLRLASKFPIHAHDEVSAEYRMHDANMSSDHAFMLRTVLDVLGRHKTAAQLDPRAFAAYREGLVNWSRYYLDLMAEEIAPNVQPGSGSQYRELDVASIRSRIRGVLARIRRASQLGMPVNSRSFVDESKLPAPGKLSFGDLRRLKPVSSVFGFDRGRPIDRHYMEQFLTQHASDVQGRVLEVGGDEYTRRFGGAQVSRADVLHVKPGNPSASFVGDLAGANDLPTEAFDAVVLTQTLHLIFELEKAAATLFRILKPGGVLLVTVPGISQLEDGEWGEPWCWSFTCRSLGLLLRRQFPEDNVEVVSHGNVLSAIAFLQGIAAEELEASELAYNDPLYPLLVTARAVRPEAA